jgi:fructose-specific PTS system IIB-like component
MKVIASTACPSGVAHTYMAAEALERAFKKAGHDIKVETQGSIGIEGELSPEDIKTADFVILTKDIAIKNEERFTGKRIVRLMVSDAIRKADALVKKLEEALNK